MDDTCETCPVELQPWEIQYARCIACRVNEARMEAKI